MVYPIRPYGSLACPTFGFRRAPSGLGIAGAPWRSVAWKPVLGGPFFKICNTDIIPPAMNIEVF